MKKRRKIFKSADELTRFIIDLSMIIVLAALWIGSMHMVPDDIKVVILFTVLICLHLSIDISIFIVSRIKNGKNHYGGDK